MADKRSEARAADFGVIGQAVATGVPIASGGTVAAAASIAANASMQAVIGQAFGNRLLTPDLVGESLQTMTQDSSSSSGGVDATAPTEFPVTGGGPTAAAGPGDTGGGPEIPGPPGVPHFPEMEEDAVDGIVSAAMLGTAVAVGVAAAAAAAPAVAASAAGAAAAAAVITLAHAQMLAEDESGRVAPEGDEDDG